MTSDIRLIQFETVHIKMSHNFTQHGDHNTQMQTSGNLSVSHDTFSFGGNIGNIGSIGGSNNRNNFNKGSGGEPAANTSKATGISCGGI